MDPAYFDHECEGCNIYLRRQPQIYHCPRCSKQMTNTTLLVLLAASDDNDDDDTAGPASPTHAWFECKPCDRIIRRPSLATAAAAVPSEQQQQDEPCSACASTMLPLAPDQIPDEGVYHHCSRCNVKVLANFPLDCPGCQTLMDAEVGCRELYAFSRPERLRSPKVAFKIDADGEVLRRLRVARGA